MIKEAIQYLVSLKDNKTYTIHGETYSDNRLERIAPHVDRPALLQVNGLDSIAKLVRNELDLEDSLPIYIRVVSPRRVAVFSTMDEYMKRDELYEATCDAPEFKGGWMDHEQAIIALRSMFVPGEGTDYLLDILSRVSKDDGVSSDDNGVSQVVTARQGVSLKTFEKVRSRIGLAPFRTFTEVAQPVSEFILRLDEGARINLIEADGGAWKMQAKANISSYFEEALKEEIACGKVVVMM